MEFARGYRQGKLTDNNVSVGETGTYLPGILQIKIGASKLARK
jgi:hypothetical protein